MHFNCSFIFGEQVYKVVWSFLYPIATGQKALLNVLMCFSEGNSAE